MCKAKEYSDQLLILMKNIEVERDSYSKELGKYDSMTDEILHKIELGKFNACEGYKLCKQLQDVRKNRRRTKYELEPLMSLHSAIKNIDAKKKIEGAKNTIMKLEDRNLYSIAKQ